MPRRWSVPSEGPARGAATFKARAHQRGGRGGPTQVVVDAFWSASEGGCRLQGPGTQARGDRRTCLGGGRCVCKGLEGGLQSPRPGHTSMGGQGVLPRRWLVRREGPARGAAASKDRAPAGGNKESCPGGGRCILKGPRGGLPSPRTGHTSPGGQGVLPKRWSVRPEGPARGAAVPKAWAHQPMWTGSLALALVGVSVSACKAGCSLPGPCTQAWGDRGCCPGGGRRWSVHPEGPARGAAVFKARAHQPGGTRGPGQIVVGAS